MSDPMSQPVDPFARRHLSPEQIAQQEYAKKIGNQLKDQIIAVFANPHGMQLLDTLIEAFVHTPVCPPGCAEGYGYKRDGENTLILFFKRIAEEAQRPKASA